MKTAKWTCGLGLMMAGCSSAQPQLGTAVMSDDGAAVKSALERGADPNATIAPDAPGTLSVYAGHSPLALAIQQSRLASVPTLLQAGADPKHREPSGYTPLHIAVANPNVTLTQALLQAGADPNAAFVPPPPPNSGSPFQPGGFGAGVAGQTPLMIAAGHYSVPKVAMLLRHGAKPDQKDTKGRTAFWYAGGAMPQAAQARLAPELRRIRQMLLAAGATPRPVDNTKRTPKQVAEREEEAEYLKRKGRPLPPLDPEVEQQVRARDQAAQERLRNRDLRVGESSSQAQ